MTELDQYLSKLFSQIPWLDSAAKPVQKFVTQLFQSGGQVGQITANLLNGTWLGHPLHPVLTDVPVGAWTAAVTLDAMEASSGRKGIGRAADAAVALGVLGAVGSAVSGIADWQHTTGESRRTGFVHGSLNVIALSLFLGSMVARGNRSRGTGRALALAGYTITAASAYLGGDLVFRQRIGVDHAPEEEQIETSEFTAVMAADHLPENQLTRAMLKNIPIVLLRRGDRVYALAETCAHLGGPLAEGRLEESSNGDPVVVCPWHGSRFDMATGDVLDGPSAYPEPCFEARIQNGQVEVRHPAMQ